MNKLVDLTGREFGKLKVLNINPERSPSGKTRWDCVCQCGNYKTIISGDLLNEATISCGCVRAERVLKAVTKHGHSKSREYRVWSCVIQRCCNPSNKDYPYYGGRGITVCDRWKESFENFYNDMGPRPSKRHSLDREDNDKGYDPDNCRWVEHSVQMNNTRRNRRFNYKGKLMTASQLSQLPEALTAGLSSKTIYTRITLLGWTVEFSVSKPLC